MDGIRIVFGRTGARVASRDREWKMGKNYFGPNKQVFYPELYEIAEALEILLRKGRVGHEASREEAESC